MSSAGEGCELFLITRCKSAWRKFRQLLPLFTNSHLLFTTGGQIYNTYVRAVMLYSFETWSLTTPSLNRLKRNDLAMIRWICKARVEDRISAEKLHAKLGIQNIESALRCHRLRWFGHVVRSSGWLSKVKEFKFVGVKRPGRPKMTWEELLKKDQTKLSLMEIDPHDRLTWKRLVFKIALPSAEKNGLNRRMMNDDCFYYYYYYYYYFYSFFVLSSLYILPSIIVGILIQIHLTSS